MTTLPHIYHHDWRNNWTGAIHTVQCINNPNAIHMASVKYKFCAILF